MSIIVFCRIKPFTWSTSKAAAVAARASRSRGEKEREEGFIVKTLFSHTFLCKNN